MLYSFIAKSDTVLVQILSLQKPSIAIGKTSLPPLKKIAPTNTSITTFPYDVDISSLPDAERFYIGNTDFKKFLTSLLANKKTMLVFSTKPKLDIAKNLLNEMGIKNI